MAEDNVRKLILKINQDALRACGGFGMAWIAWQAFTPEWVFWGFLSACAAVGGAINLVKVLWNLGRLTFSGRGLRGFKRKGVAPKSEKMADAQDLKKKGLIK